MNNDRTGETAANRLREQSATVAEDLREFGRITNEVARAKVDQARSMAGQAYQRSLRSLDEGRAYMETAVRERPLRALAIAAGVGVLVGLLIRRRA